MIRRSHTTFAWWIVALALGVASLGVASFARRLEVREPYLGIRWDRGGGAARISAVDPDGPAMRAGVEPGDVLLRVQGRPVRSSLDAISLVWDETIRRTVRLDLRRGDRAITVDVVPQSRSTVPPVYTYLSLVGLAFLVSGVFLVVRWPSVRGGTLYALLGIAVFAWTVLSHTGRADRLDWVIYWGDLAGGAIAPALLLHLCLVLSRGRPAVLRVGVALAYLPATALFFFSVWLVAFAGAQRFTSPRNSLDLRDRLELTFLALAVLLAVGILAHALARTPSGLRRSQMRWLQWGLAIGFLPFLALYALPRAAGAIVGEWTDLSVLPVLLVPGAFTAALARYRLHDLDLVLRRGLAGVALAFVTVGMYAASLVVLRRLAVDLQLPESVLGFLAALLTAVAYPKLRAFVRAAVDRAVYRARYSYRATLLDWGRELNAEMDLPSLLERLEERVSRTLPVPAARVFVRMGEQIFEAGVGRGAGHTLTLEPGFVERAQREACVVLEEGSLAEIPWARYAFGMKVKGRLGALLFTAEREGSDQPLTSEDRALLVTLSAHAATAIEAARLVREVRQHSRQVEHLKARQEQILESSGVGLLLLDAEGRILAWNRTLEGIYGLERHQAIGHHITDVFPLHTVRRIEQELAAAPTGGEARIYRHTLVNPAGHRLVVNLAISASSSGSGGDGARVVTFDDVTERVKLEEQVLRQERLASLGLLAAGVAHEVNTPLTGISSYTQMLLEDLPVNDPRREILEKIEVQSRRASTIANSLLNLARPERSTFEPLSVNDTVAEVVRLFEPQVRGSGVHVEMCLDEALPAVRGHRGKLQQVLLNLLMNARDAVEGGGSIQVSTWLRGSRVVLEVHDDGVGIAEEDLSRIFDPFFTTKGRGKGTGLGLSITHELVKEHGGEIQVESVPGESTRFRVEIPALLSEQALA